MRSVTVGDSGAKNIGASIYADVVGVTVQAQLEEINNKSATAFPVLDGSLGDVKLSNTAGQIKDVVEGHTSQLADNVYIKPSGGDDTSLIQTALTNITDGKTLKFMSGTYVISGSATILCTKNINIECEEGAVLNAVGCTANPIFKIEGSLGTFYPVVDNLVEGVTSLTLNSTLASSLNVGDIIHLSTDIAHGGSGELWTASRVYYYKGEMCMIESIVGNVVTLCNPLWDSYTASNTVVCKVNTKNVKVKNMNIVGNLANNQEGLFIQHAKNVIVDSCKFKGTSYACVVVSNCFSFDISDCFIIDFDKQAGGASYGIAVYSSQNGNIRQNTIYGGKHGITHGGTFPCRNIKVTNNTVVENSINVTGSIDCHENSEYIDFNYNTCSSFAVHGRNLSIVGNIVSKPKGSGGGGACIQVTVEKSGGFFKIINNKVKIKEGIDVTGISVRSELLNDMSIKTIEITDNIIESDRTGIEIYTIKNGLSIELVSINNNQILTGNRGITVSQNTGLTTPAIVSETIITNNYIKSLDRTVYIGGSGLLSKIVRLLNNILKTTTTNISSPEITGNETCIILNNTLEANNSTLGGYCYILSSKKIIFKNNKLIKNRLSGLLCTSPIIHMDGNVYEDTILSTASITGVIIISSTPLSKTTVLTTAPTSGAWVKGDRCINTNPVVGQPKAWTCTVAGTPGTWISEGNL